MAAIKTDTGLPKVNEPRYHFDIYAILEGPQELYFGHETQVNVNIVETVRIATDKGEVEKCYISPTKRRGVERRSLIWAPVQSAGVLLGDKLGCGIPHTCAQPTCPICAVYGGLITGDTDAEVMGQTQNRKATTMIGRLVHGGGVAVQAQDVVEKQRAMHPSMLHKEPGKEPTPTPFKRQYNEPGLLYPVYNHCLSVTEAEFSAVAYAFLDALARLGAGNPKGVRIYEAALLQDKPEPLLVVDRYLVPLGKRPVISPSLTSVEEALARFRADALQVADETIKEGQVSKNNFTRWVGDAALGQLQCYATQFVDAHLK
ncbi:MAG: hypothetical protein ACP5OO_12845 [Chloroflexia bacterium]